MPGQYPPMRPGKWTYGGGVAAHKSRPLGNWPSDDAIDMMAKAHTAIFAAADGVIRNLGFSDNGRTVWGWKFYLIEPNGEEHFYTHMAKPRVREGEKVRGGQWLGVVGDPPYFPSHLHYAKKRGNPETQARLPWPKPAPPKLKWGQRPIVWKIKDKRWIINRLKRARAKLRRAGKPKKKA